jgi:hypothetical protein
MLHYERKYLINVDSSVKIFKASSQRIEQSELENYLMYVIYFNMEHVWFYCL